MKTTTKKTVQVNIVDDIIFNTFWETLSAKQRKILKQVFQIRPVYLADVKESLKRSDNSFYHLQQSDSVKHKIIEAYKISSFTYSESEFYKIWRVKNDESRKLSSRYQAKPKKEGRDNKDVRVGSGGGSITSIRFPKQRANKSVWKKFWKLFPLLENCKSWEDYRIKQANINETL